MNIRYYLRGTKELKNIYIRLTSKGIDLSAPVGVFTLDFNWDSNKELTNSDVVNSKLFKLKSTLLEQYNNSLISGQIIDKSWILEIIKDIFNRPKQEVKLVSKDYTIYLVDFCKYWMEECASKWKTSANKFMSEVIKTQYNKFIENLESYEKSRKNRIKLKEADIDFIYSFVSYLSSEQKFSLETTKRAIVRLKFFLKRAAEMDFEVNKDYLKPVYIEKQPEVQDVYLSEEEIQRIFDLDLNHDSKLDIARDNLVLTCWLGLRISDFMTRLNIDDIKDGYASIKTKKTGSFVTIPLHPMAKSILSKRLGALPPKMSNTEHNLRIKDVCRIAGMEEVVYGKKHNPETDRKEIGYYRKYELVTSHTARRSLCTNLYGKTSNDVLRSILGWSSDVMVKHYNKTSKKQHASSLNDMWNEQK